jgi:hypothetical protein
MASRKSCARIAESLPFVKLVMLLRDPVDRAYSEYQMKLRRVSKQEAYFRLLISHQRRIFQCFISLLQSISVFSSSALCDRSGVTQQNDCQANDGTETDSVFIAGLKECVPSAIATDTRWSKLQTALKSAKSFLGSWRAVVDMCFPPPAVNGQSDLTYPLGEKSAINLSSPGKYENYSKGCQEATSCIERAEPLFSPHSCWSHSKKGYEHIKSIEEAFTLEIDEFEHCAASAFPGFSTGEEEAEAEDSYTFY